MITHGNQVVSVDLSDRDDLKEEALEIAANIDGLSGSITGGEGSMAGALAELAFVDTFGGRRDATFEYDVYLNGLRVELKTTRRTVPPEPWYNVVVSDWNTEQDCDFYYFTSFNTESEVLSFLGGHTPKVYYDRAEFRREGESEENGFVFSHDCYSLRISDLRQPSRVLEVARGND